MKALFFIVLLLLLGTFAVSYRIAGMQLACTKTYQPAIDSVASKSQGLFADKRRICENSYFAVSDLEECLKKTDALLPSSVMKTLRPIVSNISVFLRNQTKDIESFKAEHDERCKDYTEFMFNPPAAE